ncbi:hypothetical protein MOE90_20340 [Bacillus spizizenii]|nr:hypothetical protein [Bacillus spizizenii]MCY9124955.1 hypothetical protein [Bacillus spizizenii]
MKVKCKQDVVVSGRTVYVEGTEYNCVFNYKEGKLISHDITGECGKGVFLAGDPSLEQFFDITPEPYDFDAKDYTDEEPVSEHKPEEKHGMGKILSFFKRK